MSRVGHWVHTGVIVYDEAGATVSAVAITARKNRMDLSMVSALLTPERI